MNPKFRNELTHTLNFGFIPEILNRVSLTLLRISDQSEVQIWVISIALLTVQLVPTSR